MIYHHEVLWRAKMEFADGCGSAHLIAQFAENEISDAEFERQRRPSENIQISSKEELYYFKLFQSFFSTEALSQTIGKWRGSFAPAGSD